MVPQMVIRVVNRDRKHNSPPQFFQISIRFRPLLDDQFNEIEIIHPGNMIIAVVLPQKRHRRSKVNAVFSICSHFTIKSPGHVGAQFSTELLQPRLGHGKARGDSQLMRHHFPRAHVTFIVPPR